MLEECGSGSGFDLQVVTDLDCDKKPYDTPIVRFLSSYDKGSQCVGMKRTFTGFLRIKNSLENNKEKGNMSSRERLNRKYSAINS